MSVNKTVENVYLRHDAVQLTRKHFWRLLGMTLLVSLITVGLEYLQTWLVGLLNAPTGAASAETLVAATPTAASSALGAVFNLIYAVVTALITSGLALGYIAQFISAGRGGVPKVFGVFKRMRYCLKSWGLDLLISLKLLLWMLPGLITGIVGAELSIHGYTGIANWVIFAGFALMFGLVIPASLRYSLASYTMADEPDRGIRECITLSKGLMKDRKWQYFKLGVPMILKMIGMIYAVSFAGALVIMLLGLMENPYVMDILVYLALLSCIYFALQLNMAYALFYLKRREPVADAPEAAEASESPDAPETADVVESPEAPAESPEDSPEDISPETKEEKENEQ